MPKRECPFDYDLLPQTKVHVGEIEVNTGSMKTTKMKLVYEKTLGLLFKGARYSVQTGTVQKDPTAPNTNKPYKQMFLNSVGQLQTSGVLMSQPLIECDVCSSSLKPCQSASCDFCDRHLCNKCAFTCVKCLDKFCSNCILITSISGNICAIYYCFKIKLMQCPINPCVCISQVGHRSSCICNMQVLETLKFASAVCTENLQFKQRIPIF